MSSSQLFNFSLIHSQPILKIIRLSKSSVNFSYFNCASAQSAVSSPKVSITSPRPSISISNSLCKRSLLCSKSPKIHKIPHRRNHMYLLMAKLIYTAIGNILRRRRFQFSVAGNSSPRIHRLISVSLRNLQSASLSLSILLWFRAFVRRGGLTSPKSGHS